MARPFVIGIAGGSGAGKTSLANGLVDWLVDTKVLHLDNYFAKEENLPLFAGVMNWDEPQSVRDKDLLADINELIDRGDDKFIIVEGFLLFHFPELRRLCDARIFLKAPHEIINKRRVHDADEHYREHVIKPMYEKYVLPSAQHAEYVIDVSRATQGEVLVRVMSLLKSQISL